MVRAGLPAGTIVANFSHSSRNACGGGCDPAEKKHITRLAGYSGTGGSGCGNEFTHISTPSSLAKIKNAARAMRPDLEFIEFPTHGR